MLITTIMTAQAAPITGGIVGGLPLIDLTGTLAPFAWALLGYVGAVLVAMGVFLILEERRSRRRKNPWLVMRERSREAA